MPNLLQQLENNEAVLLMYLAGELPEEDRVEVEQLLSVDANLRAELESLRKTQAGVVGMMQAADAATRPPMTKEVAARTAGRAMRQWFADQAARESLPEEPAPTARVPWWIYTSAAAVVLLIVYVAWWGIRGDVPPGLPGTEPGIDYALPYNSTHPDGSDRTGEDLIRILTSADDLIDPDGHYLAPFEMQLVTLTSVPEELEWTPVEQ
ncbi:MAG: anti-sigma factor family protein [Tepidisphaeraceae bacterium]